MNELLKQAIELEESGCLQESVEIYEKLRIDHPQNVLIELNYAACLFKMQTYDKALDLFVWCYNNSLDPTEKQQILTHILDAYHTPNAEGFQQRYLQNVESLLAYEYNYIAEFPAYDELPFICIPRNTTSYYIYIKSAGKILESYITPGIDKPYAISVNETVLAVNIYDAEAITVIEQQTANPLWQNNFKRPLYLLWEQAHYLIYLQVQDFSPLLATNRIVFFPDCDADFVHFFHDYQSHLPEKVIGISDDFQKISELVRTFIRERERCFSEKLTAVQQMAEQYDRSFYRELFNGDRRNIRILCYTSRFTRVVQHSTRDFMQACKEQGLTCDILIEKSDIHICSSLVFLDKIAEFRPNVIFRINYFKANFPEIPENILFLTWMQDPGPLLYSQQYAAKFGWNDFALALSQWQKAMVESGYAQERLSIQQMPFNEEQFYQRSLSEEERELYGAAIALPSNYNTPGDVLADLISDCGNEITGSSEDKAQKTKMVTRLLIQAYETFRSQIEAGILIASNGQCTKVIKEKAEALDLFLGESTIHEIAERFLLRICYGLHRQTTLKWVVDGGFPLKIWGRDWEKDDFLRNYACGLLHHGEELAKMYSATKIILATFSSYTGHFRVFEALACGALPFIRYVPEEYDQSSIRGDFREDEHFVFYHNKADLLNKLDYYLKHEDERLKIVADGRKRALECVTYRNVVENFLGLVRRNLS